MKYLLLFVLLHAFSGSYGQEKRGERSVEFTVEGEVKKSIRFSFADAAKFTKVEVDSVMILNHEMKYRKTIHHIRGVLLRDIIREAGIKMDSPKLLSEYYFTCTATDGYMVTFSWNELFNTSIGKKVIIITSVDGKEASAMEEGLTLLSGDDEATGRRFVYNISKVSVNRANK